MTRIQSDSGQVIQVEKCEGHLQLILWGVDKTSNIEADLSREQAVLLQDAIIDVVNRIARPEPEPAEPCDRQQEPVQDGSDIDPYDLAILDYAVRKNKGTLKVSTVKNHINPQYGQRMMTAEEIRTHLNFMVPKWLDEPRRVGQVYVWTVTERGRSVVL